MTDGQIKALFTLIEYVARLAVEIRKDTEAIKKVVTRDRDHPRSLRDQNAKLRQEVRDLKKQVKELHILLEKEI